MSTRVELETAIAARLAAWSAPCQMIRENEPAQTRDLAEWARVTINDGFSFISTTAGLLDVRGSTAAHPFVLSFDIYTPYNTGTLRAAAIGQAISDHWAYVVLDDVHFDAATFATFGEENKIYHTAVTVDAVRYETLDPR
jgi:hypothetical protein